MFRWPSAPELTPALGTSTITALPGARQLGAAGHAATSATYSVLLRSDADSSCSAASCRCPVPSRICTASVQQSASLGLPSLDTLVGGAVS